MKYIALHLHVGISIQGLITFLFKLKLAVMVCRRSFHAILKRTTSEGISQLPPHRIHFLVLPNQWDHRRGASVYQELVCEGGVTIVD